MEKTMNFFFALALMAVAMVFASCSKGNDANPADGNKEYLFEARCHISTVEGDESVQQQEYVNAALAKVGFTGESYFPLSILGKDSAAVSKVLLEKMAQVEKAIADAPFEINAKLCIVGSAKINFTSEDKKVLNVYIWYEKEFGTPSNANENVPTPSRTIQSELCHFVKGLRSVYSTNNKFLISGNTNEGGGKEMYVQADVSGEDGEYFKWEEEEYITDVIAVTVPDMPRDPSKRNLPNQIRIAKEMKEYVWEKSVDDLNCGRTEGYNIAIYVCRKKFKESDGNCYYLNTGGIIDSNNASGRKAQSSCSLYCLNYFDAGFYAATTPYVVDGHKFVDRVVPMYDLQGKLVQKEANFNRGVRGVPYIKLILSYATKEGGY